MIEDRLETLLARLEALSRRRVFVLFFALTLATILATLVLMMGAPPTVVYQAF